VHDDVDDTVIRPRAPLAPSTVPTDIEDTVIRPRSPLPAGVPIGDAEDTVVRGVASVATGLPAVPVLPPLPAAVAERVASVRVTVPGEPDRVIRLDTPLVLGRHPTTSRVPLGPAPMLVAVGRPRGQVSGSHLAVRSEGSAVVVEDLRSTNGTVVRPPGAPTYRLPSGASRVVLTGTLVEIGDGITIEILSPHLRAATGAFPAPPTTRERSTP
jgi:hypothetical protein